MSGFSADHELSIGGVLIAESKLSQDERVKEA